MYRCAPRAVKRTRVVGSGLPHERRAGFSHRGGLGSPARGSDPRAGRPAHGLLRGLPGMGKSLLAHQLVHVASGAGRQVHLLQWDVARPVFEASPAGRRYPVLDGVTHAVIRRAAGLWVRDAVAGWSARYGGLSISWSAKHPSSAIVSSSWPGRSTIGPKLLLASPSCRFVIATPSREVRSFLEAQRERRTADAPPPSRARGRAAPRAPGSPGGASR